MFKLALAWFLYLANVIHSNLRAASTIRMPLTISSHAEDDSVLLDWRTEVVFQKMREQMSFLPTPTPFTSGSWFSLDGTTHSTTAAYFNVTSETYADDTGTGHILVFVVLLLFALSLLLLLCRCAGCVDRRSTPVLIPRRGRPVVIKAQDRFTKPGSPRQPLPPSPSRIVRDVEKTPLILPEGPSQSLLPRLTMSPSTAPSRKIVYANQGTQTGSARTAVKETQTAISSADKTTQTSEPFRDRVWLVRRVETLEKSRRQLCRELDDARTKLADAIEKAKTTPDYTSMRHYALQQRLSKEVHLRHEAELEAARAETQARIADHEAEKRWTKDLAAQVLDLQTQLTRAEGRLIVFDLRKEVKRLGSELTSVRRVADKATKEKQEAQQRVDEDSESKRHEMETLRAKLTSMESDLAREKHRARQMTEDLLRASGEREALIVKLASTTEEQEKEKRLLEQQYDEQISAAQAEIQHVRAELTTTVRGLELENKQLSQQHVERCSAAHADMERVHSNLTSTIAALEKEKKQLEQQHVEHLSDPQAKMQLTQTKLASRLAKVKREKSKMLQEHRSKISKFMAQERQLHGTRQDLENALALEKSKVFLLELDIETFWGQGPDQTYLTPPWDVDMPDPAWGIDMPGQAPEMPVLAPVAETATAPSAVMLDPVHPTADINPELLDPVQQTEDINPELLDPQLFLSAPFHTSLAPATAATYAEPSDMLDLSPAAWGLPDDWLDSEMWMATSAPETSAPTQGPPIPATEITPAPVKVNAPNMMHFGTESFASQFQFQTQPVLAPQTFPNSAPDAPSAAPQISVFSAVAPQIHSLMSETHAQTPAVETTDPVLQPASSSPQPPSTPTSQPPAEGTCFCGEPFSPGTMLCSDDSCIGGSYTPAEMNAF